jgi:NADH-quinone oxidoreductase subunit M
MQMITHGISTSALFILVGALQERIHTRNIDLMGGLWEKVPRMAGIGMLFAMASLGLPGLGNFIAEFQVLAGSFRADIFWTSIATVGLIASTIYSLKIVQRVFHGNKLKEWTLPDFNIREIFVFGVLIISIIWLGLYPQPVLDTSRNSVLQIQNSVRTEQTTLNDASSEAILNKDVITGGEE